MPSRRAVLAGSVAVSALLAGCSSGESPDETPTDEPTGTESPTGTPTASPTATGTPTPEPTTVENFSYPAGASRQGIEAGSLFDTHRSAITDAGSATVDLEQTRESGDFSSSFTQTNAFSAEGLSQTTERGDVTETLWTPADESVAYVRMDTGFEQRYRIENAAPRPQELVQLPLVESVLAGATWSEATRVVETSEGGHAVVYDATGVADEQTLLDGTVHGQAVSEFTASVSVTESGRVGELSYSVTVERERDPVTREATATVHSLGSTTVAEPSWSATAREDGVQFRVDTVADNSLVALELVNGTDVPARTQANLSATRFASGSLGQSLAVGDTCYLGVSGNGDLLVGVNEMPDGGTDLGRFVFLTLRFEAFTLFEQDIQL